MTRQQNKAPPPPLSLSLSPSLDFPPSPLSVVCLPRFSPLSLSLSLSTDPPLSSFSPLSALSLSFSLRAIILSNHGVSGSYCLALAAPLCLLTTTDHCWFIAGPVLTHQTSLSGGKWTDRHLVIRLILKTVKAFGRSPIQHFFSNRG